MGVPVKRILAPNAVPSVISLTTAPAKRLASDSRLEQKRSKELIAEASRDFEPEAYKTQAILNRDESTGVEAATNSLESRQVMFVSGIESSV